MHRTLFAAAVFVVNMIMSAIECRIKGVTFSSLPFALDSSRGGGVVGLTVLVMFLIAEPR